MPEPSTRPPFDFDAWALLARNDPQAFEARRTNEIENAIQQAPAQRRQRLRGLQWKLDQVRSLAPSPLAAAVRMHDLMWESVTGADGLLARLQLGHEQGSVEKIYRTSAKILEFQK